MRGSGNEPARERRRGLTIRPRVVPPEKKPPVYGPFDWRGMRRPTTTSRRPKNSKILATRPSRKSESILRTIRQLQRSTYSCCFNHLRVVEVLMPRRRQFMHSSHNEERAMAADSIVLEPDGRGSYRFTFSSPRGEVSGRVSVGTEGPPDRRSEADQEQAAKNQILALSRELGEACGDTMATRP
jgi:hypothetical protein